MAGIRGGRVLDDVYLVKIGYSGAEWEFLRAVINVKGNFILWSIEI